MHSKALGGGRVASAHDGSGDGSGGGGVGAVRAEGAEEEGERVPEPGGLRALRRRRRRGRSALPVGPRGRAGVGGGRGGVGVEVPEASDEGGRGAGDGLGGGGVGGCADAVRDDHERAVLEARNRGRLRGGRALLREGVGHRVEEAPGLRARCEAVHEAEEMVHRHLLLLRAGSLDALRQRRDDPARNLRIADRCA